MLSIIKRLNPGDISTERGKNFFTIKKNIVFASKDDERRLCLEFAYQKCISSGVFKDLKKLK